MYLNGGCISTGDVHYLERNVSYLSRCARVVLASWMPRTYVAVCIVFALVNVQCSNGAYTNIT